MHEHHLVGLNAVLSYSHLLLWQLQVAGCGFWIAVVVVAGVAAAGYGTVNSAWRLA